MGLGWCTSEGVPSRLLLSWLLLLGRCSHAQSAKHVLLWLLGCGLGWLLRLHKCEGRGRLLLRCRLGRLLHLHVGEHVVGGLLSRLNGGCRLGH